MAENHHDFRVFIEDIYSRLKVSNDTNPDDHGDEHHDNGNFFAMITLGVMGFFFFSLFFTLPLKIVVVVVVVVQQNIHNVICNLQV
eukprot:UN00201